MYTEWVSNTAILVLFLFILFLFVSNTAILVLPRVCDIHLLQTFHVRVTSSYIRKRTQAIKLMLLKVLVDLYEDKLLTIVVNNIMALWGKYVLK